MAASSHQSLNKHTRLNLKLTLQFVDTRHQSLLSRIVLRRWVKIALSQQSQDLRKIVLASRTFAASAQIVRQGGTTPPGRFCISPNAEITLRFVDSIEGQALNYNYRGKNYPTNVLTFPYTDDEQEDQLLQADLVLCPEIIEQEANAQNKALLAHYAHLIIHGVLHAQGYTHDEEDEAQQMESLEVLLLAELGFPNPYHIG